MSGLYTNILTWPLNLDVGTVCWNTHKPKVIKRLNKMVIHLQSYWWHAARSLVILSGKLNKKCLVCLLVHSVVVRGGLIWKRSFQIMWTNFYNFFLAFYLIDYCCYYYYPWIFFHINLVIKTFSINLKLTICNCKIYLPYLHQ